MESIDKEEYSKLMESSNITCFNNGIVSTELLKERNKMTSEKQKILDGKLDKLVNEPQPNYMDVTHFNYVNGLTVEYMYCGKFYSICLKLENAGKEPLLCFVAYFKKLKEDIDDDEKHLLSSFEYVKFNVLRPKIKKDGKKELTIDMYFDFVIECLKMRPEDHVYM